ncbi:MAG: hypothetical protein AAF320_02890 [Myxococcota bacterium]
MVWRQRVGLMIVCLLVGSMTTGCARKLLPGTLVDDTKENRAILLFFGTYKSAVESHNVDAVMKLVDSGYTDAKVLPGGKVERYNRENLEERLRENFTPRMKAMGLQLYIERITKLKKQPACWNKRWQKCNKKKKMCQSHSKRVCQKVPSFEVIYRYIQRACFEVPAGETCKSASDVNKVILRQLGKKSKDGFTIVAGGV